MKKEVLFGLSLLFLLLTASIINAEITGYTITGQETMTRIARNLNQSVGEVAGLLSHTPSQNTTKINSNFIIDYTAQGADGAWAATIVDSVSGGCGFPGGSSFRDVMISDAGNTRTIIINAPSSAGSCIFTGDYQFGNFPVKNFTSLIINICNPECVRPSSCQANSEDGCGGTCNWQITQNTDADTNCDGAVDRAELGEYIMLWIAGEVTRESLGEVIMAWAV